MVVQIGISDGRHDSGLAWLGSAFARVRHVTDRLFRRAPSRPAVDTGRADLRLYWIAALSLPIVGIAAAGVFTLHNAIGHERVEVLRLTKLLTLDMPRAELLPDTIQQVFAEAAGEADMRLTLLRADGAVLARTPPRRQSGPPVQLAANDPTWRLVRAMTAGGPAGGLASGRVGGAATAVEGSLLRGIRVSGFATLPTVPPLLVLVQGDPAVVLQEWLTGMLFPALGAVSTMLLLWMLGMQARRELRRERSSNAHRIVAVRASQRVSEQRAELEARLRQTEKAAALGQLSAGVAHDFNNLLHAVLLGTDGLRRAAGTTPQSTEMQRAVRLIERTAERGVALTRRMLDFARRDDTVDGGGFDPGAALGEAVELLTHSFGHGWPAALRLPPAPLPMVAGDSATFETVVINLAINARDAMPRGGRVEVSAKLEVADFHAPLLSGARAVRVVVRDTGTGMDAATLARAGEAFFSTKPTGSGTGLGLSMARGFAQRVGGLLEIASEPDVGTTVTLRLPLA